MPSGGLLDRGHRALQVVALGLAVLGLILALAAALRLLYQPLFGPRP